MPSKFRGSGKRRGGLSPKEKRENPEIHARNLLQWKEYQWLAEQRKLAKAEYNAFIAAWTAKWKHIRVRKGKPNKQRRHKLIKATILLGDKALAHQIEAIHVGPCACYWCKKRLPRGGTVDHIIALANGGKHTSDNVCASCSKCNSDKQHSPQEYWAPSPSLL